MSTPITPELVDAYRADLHRLASTHRRPATTRRWFRRGHHRDVRRVR